MARRSSTSIAPWYHYLRRNSGGGGAGNDIASAGEDLGRGISQAITRGKENNAANTQMQAYNDINPPRADLVSVPGESVQDFQKQNPNVPTQQSTIPAPYGQGAAGMGTWMQMQNLTRAQDTAKQQAVIRGMQMAREGEQFDYNKQMHPLDYKYKQMQIDALQGKQGQQGGIPSADLVRMAEANALTQRYMGLPLDSAMQHSQDWKLSADGKSYTNDTLSGHYNKTISIPVQDFNDNWAKISGAGALLQKHMTNPASAAQLGQQLQLQGQQINQTTPPNTTAQPGQSPQVQRAQPIAGGAIPQNPTDQQVLPPSSNMQSDYFKQNPPSAGSGQAPGQPPGQPPAQPLPTPAGTQGKQQSPADSYIQKAISGGFPNRIDQIEGQ